MGRPPLPEMVRELLAQPNPAVITTLRASGQPVSVATWYLLEADGRVLVNMDEGRRRVAYLRRDPRVSLTVLKADDWYTHVSLQGSVASLEEDPHLSDIDRLARHYTGHPYHTRDRRRLSARIDVGRWHGWGKAAERGS